MKNTNTVAGSGFRAGDNVVLAKGTYEGTRGVFRHFNKDINWAEIEESNSKKTRSHPVIWLRRTDS
jgi:hypothetical protein